MHLEKKIGGQMKSIAHFSIKCAQEEGKEWCGRGKNGASQEGSQGDRVYFDPLVFPVNFFILDNRKSIAPKSQA